MQSGVLLLSHCGFSFIEELLAALKARGLEAYVLSSQPLPEQRERLEFLGANTKWLSVTNAHTLVRDDVEHALDELTHLGCDVRACISVWEGYREFVAHANRRLGVADLAPERIATLRDKLALRKALRAANETSVRAGRLTPARLEAFRKHLVGSKAQRFFVKPIHGIASYGAFPLRSNTTWQDLENIADEASHDLLYQALIGDKTEFLVEDYIDGREFSFEVLARNGRRFVVAIHEKLNLTERGATVLEDCCISPPIHLNLEQRAAALAWIERICSALNLDHGCYHIEARYNGKRWEVIEVNPRVGGSLISASVAASTGTAGMLDLWLECLLAQDATSAARIEALLEEISIERNGEIKSDTETVFRVFFAEAGKIADIACVPLRHPPTITQIFLHPGDEIEQSSREVFLGQCLWTYPATERYCVLPTLLHEAPRAIQVTYSTFPVSVAEAA